MAGVPFVVGGYVAEQVFAARPNVLLFRGRHPVLDRPVLLKILRPEILAGASEERKLVDDARAIGRLRHENIASLVDFGRDESSDAWYVVSDVDPRETLGDVIRRGPLSIDRAIPILLQVVRALAAAPRRISADDVLFIQTVDGREVVKVDLSPPSAVADEDLFAPLLRELPAPLASALHGWFDGEDVDLLEIERALEARAAQDPLLGQAIGPYRISCLVGTDDVSTVYLAQHPVVDARVHVKVLREGAGRAPGARDRYVKQATAASQLGDVHIARVFGFGTLPGGELYAVTDWFEGETLEERLHRDGSVPFTEAAVLVRQIAEAMMTAHAGGVVHGDLEPESVLLSRDDDGWPLVRLLDFGVPWLRLPAGSVPKAEDDVYCLGGMALKMFGAESVADLPDGCADTIARMLSSDAAARPAMAEVVDACIAWQAPQRIAAPAEPFELDDEAPPTSRWLLALAGVLFLALVAAIVLFVVVRKPAAQPAQAPSPTPAVTAPSPAPAPTPVSEQPPVVEQLQAPAPAAAPEPANAPEPEKKKKKKKHKKTDDDDASSPEPASTPFQDPFAEPAPPASATRAETPAGSPGPTLIEPRPLDAETSHDDDATPPISGE